MLSRCSFGSPPLLGRTIYRERDWECWLSWGVNESYIVAIIERWLFFVDWLKEDKLTVWNIAEICIRDGQELTTWLYRKSIRSTSTCFDGYQRWRSRSEEVWFDFFDWTLLEAVGWRLQAAIKSFPSLTLKECRSLYGYKKFLDECHIQRGC